MSTSSPEQPDGEQPLDTAERLDSAEERLDSIEEADRLNSIEERLRDLEDETGARPRENDQHSNVEGEGEKALRLALAQLLSNESVIQALTGVINTAGQVIKDRVELTGKENEAQRHVSMRMYYSGLAFSAFLLLVLSTLLWDNKITKELAAGLIGSLIGYWYGRDKPKG
jgi:hypothetical protein